MLCLNETRQMISLKAGYSLKQYPLLEFREICCCIRGSLQCCEMASSMGIRIHRGVDLCKNVGGSKLHSLLVK